MISWTASGMVMKKRVMSACVTVSGPPRAICLRKIGMTLPDEPRTFPKRTPQNLVLVSSRSPHDSMIHSQMRLRLAHDRLRVDRLVRGDQHEALRAELDGDVGDRAGDERVVPDRLERVRLHERDVFVRGRVEDDGGAVLLEDLANLRRVARVREHRRSRMEVALVDELALDLEEAGLAVVDENESSRAHAGDLAAELRADRAAGAGHEHDLVREVARDRVEVDLHRLAPEEVLHLDRADLPGEVEVARDELVQVRQRLHRNRLRARRAPRSARGRHRTRTE